MVLGVPILKHFSVCGLYFRWVGKTFGTNGKLMVLGVPILKHFRVCVLYFRLVVQKCMTITRS